MKHIYKYIFAIIIALLLTSTLQSASKAFDSLGNELEALQKDCEQYFQDPKLSKELKATCENFNGIVNKAFNVGYSLNASVASDTVDENKLERYVGLLNEVDESRGRVRELIRSHKKQKAEEENAASPISKSDNLPQWVIIIIELLAIVVAFFTIKKFFPKRKNLSFEEEIPDTFLELSPELRKQALTYPLNIEIKAFDIFSAKPFKLAIIDIFIKMAIIIFGTITLIIFFMEGPIVAFIISLLFTSLLIYLALKNKLEIDYTIETERIERLQREKLTKIASTFINKNVESWIRGYPIY